jgi:tetratricopeptide (TPR) repeat protein
MHTSSSTTSPAAANLNAAMHLGTAIRRVALGAALVGLAAVVGMTGTRLDAAAATAARTDEPVYLPRAEYLRPMSLGWQNVLADILWFRTISYFGEHYRSDRTYPWLAEMCDLVTDLDPRAEHVYRFAGFILPWEANQSDAGIRLLEKGARQFPDSWQLQYFLGFQSYFFKNDYPKALAHLRHAAQLPGVHPSVAQLIAVLAAEQYGPETTLEFLAELERNVDSPELREVVRENMQEAQLAQDLQRLQGAVDAYRERTGHAPLTAETLVDVGLLSSLPADPFGGSFVIDQLSGTARSSTGRTPSRLHQSKVRERALRGEPLREQ